MSSARLPPCAGDPSIIPLEAEGDKLVIPEAKLSFGLCSDLRTCSIR